MLLTIDLPVPDTCMCSYGIAPVHGDMLFQRGECVTHMKMQEFQEKIQVLW